MLIIVRVGMGILYLSVYGCVSHAVKPNNDLAGSAVTSSEREPSSLFGYGKRMSGEPVSASGHLSGEEAFEKLKDHLTHTDEAVELVEGLLVRLFPFTNA